MSLPNVGPILSKPCWHHLTAVVHHGTGPAEQLERDWGKPLMGHRSQEDRSLPIGLSTRVVRGPLNGISY